MPSREELLRRKNAKKKGLSSAERRMRYETAHQKDLAEIEIWKRVALELSELNK